MCDWDKNITCDCPELPLPWGLAVNEVKYDLREKERIGGGAGLKSGAHLPLCGLRRKKECFGEALKRENLKRLKFWKKVGRRGKRDSDESLL